MSSVQVVGAVGLIEITHHKHIDGMSDICRKSIEERVTIVSGGQLLRCKQVYREAYRKWRWCDHGHQR